MLFYWHANKIKKLYLLIHIYEIVCGRFSLILLSICQMSVKKIQMNTYFQIKNEIFIEIIPKIPKCL